MQEWKIKVKEEILKDYPQKSYVNSNSQCNSGITWTEINTTWK